MVKSLVTVPDVRLANPLWILRLAALYCAENTGTLAMFNYMEKNVWAVTAVFNYTENSQFQN